MEEEISILKLQVTELKQLLISTVKSQVKIAVENIAKKDSSPGNAKTQPAMLQRQSCSLKNQSPNHSKRILRSRISGRCPDNIPEDKDFEISEGGKVLIHERTEKVKRRYETRRKLIKCDSCPKAFKTLTQLNIHNRIHDSQLRNVKFCCPLCDKNYETVEGLFVHQGYYPEKDVHYCSSCNKMFTSLQSLTIHYNKDHKDAPKKILDYLENAIEVRRKRKNIGRHVSYQCDICSQRFRNVNAFNKHILNHERERTKTVLKFSCPVCKEKFYSVRKLLRHGQLHNTLNDYYCECRECRASFNNLDSLIIHYHKNHSDVSEKVVEILETSLQRCRKESNISRRRNYKCELCTMEFKEIGELHNHILSHEKEECQESSGFVFVCPLCEKTFGSTYSLFRHQQSHPKKTDLKCLVCNEQFDCIENITIHYHKEHTKISERLLDMMVKLKQRKRYEIYKEGYYCDRCTTRFSDYRLYTDHEIYHLQELAQGPPLIFDCPTCLKDCPTIWKLLVHLTDHKVVANSKCKTCGETFQDLNSLAVHFYKSHFQAAESVSNYVQNIVQNALGYGSDPESQKMKEIICNICGNKYAYMNKLTSHKYMVHVEKQFCCEFCGKAFKKIDPLNKHRLLHLESHEKRRIDCKACGKTFASNKSYKCHYIALHTDEKPFTCNICGRAYNSAPTLHMHKITVCEKHMAKKRNCNICGKIFENYLLLFHHRENVHRYGNPDDTHCHLCLRAFEKCGSLYSHNINCHRIQKETSGQTGRATRIQPANYSCNLCSATRNCKKLLFDHWLIHNAEKSFECLTCQIKFKQKCGFYQHRKTKHKNDKKIQMTTDLRALKQLKDAFKTSYRMSPMLSSETRQTQKEVHPLNSTTLNTPGNDCSPCSKSEKNGNPRGTPTNKSVITDPKNVEELADGVKSYIDFSRANVSGVSLKLPEVMSLDLQLAINNKEKINKAANLPTTHTRKTKNYEDNNVIFHSPLLEPANFDLSIDDSYEEDFNDSNSFTADLKPNIAIAFDSHFLHDPFPKKLIVAIQRLNIFDCSICNLMFWQLKDYKMHERTRKHRSAMKNHQTNNIKSEYRNIVRNTIKRELREFKAIELHFGDSTSTDKVKKANETNLKQCFLCKCKFSSSRKLKDHYISSHDGKNVISCKICGQTFLYSKSLRVHMIAQHKESGDDSVIKTYGCDSCEEIFSNHKLYKRHLATHKTYKYKCVLCKKLFDNQNDLQDHYAVSHKNEMPYKCTKCSLEFSTQFRLKLHNKDVHSMDEISKESVNGKFICDQCGKCYKKINTLISHAILHDQKVEKRIVCEVCTKPFVKEASLIAHRKIHAEEGSYSCDQCETTVKKLTFVSARRKREHINKVHLKRAHVCEVCGKFFTKQSKLNVHLRTHTGETPYPCKECDKSFISSTHLKEHVDKAHLGIRHVCDTCGKLFSDMRNLRKHKKIHAGVNKSSPCDHCGNTYSSASDLKRHINSVHLKLSDGYIYKHLPKPFECSVCLEKFRSQKALDKHLLLHDPNRPFSCSLCSFRFNFNSNLVLHRKNVHEKQGIDYWSKRRKALKVANECGNEITGDNRNVNA